MNDNNQNDNQNDNRNDNQNQRQGVDPNEIKNKLIFFAVSIVLLVIIKVVFGF